MIWTVAFKPALYWAKQFLLILHNILNERLHIYFELPLRYVSWCFSFFPPLLQTAVNGIVYNMERLGSGVHLITFLVNSDGLYKMNHLSIPPDGCFFRIHILIVDSLNCSKPCPDFKFGKQILVKSFHYFSCIECNFSFP